MLDRLTIEEKQIINDAIDGLTDLFTHQELYEKLYNYYVFETAQMPYGTAKARDGDPDVWIMDQLEYEMRR
jgi:hypothetical protein